MPSTCEFQLNSPHNVYYSGETISAAIILKTTSEKNIRNIRIRFLGEAKVHWTETERHRKSDGKYENRTVYFQANEVYVDNSTMVRGEGTLAPGTYTYTFNITLPISCPTSCEGKYGNIRYALWVIVDRPFRFDNEFSKPLTVLRKVDLNLNPSFKVPLQCDDISSIGCWPCSSGKITYVLTIPFGAYAPGQTLRYSLLVQNQSMTDISNYCVEFQERITFTAHTPRHKTREKVSVIKSQQHSDNCVRLTNRKFEGQIVLPALPPDTEGSCIIRVQHFLKLEMSVEGCHSNNTVTIPVVIGNVPIRESFMPIPQAPPPPLQEQAGTSDNGYMGMTPSAPLLPPPTNEKSDRDMPPSYGDLSPPSFEEAVRSPSPFVDPDANGHSNVIGFRPMYPMYPQQSFDKP